MGCPLLRVLVMSIAVLSAVSQARAQDAAPSTVPAAAKRWGARLEFVGVTGCVSETDFRNAVATIFDGVDPFDPDSPRVLRVTFTKVANGYRATLEYTPADGGAWPPEPIGSGPCFAVVQSAARTASWAVGDPPKEPPTTPPEPDPVPSAEPPKPPPDPIPSPPARVAPASFAELRSATPPPPPPTMDLTLTLNTALLLTAGLTANVGPALQLGAGLRRNWFSVDLELRGVFPGQATAREAVDPTLPTNPVAFDLSQLSAQLVPCVRFATYFAGCGVVGAYTFIMQDHAGTVFGPGWTIGPRFGVEVPIGERFAVFSFGEALFFPQPFALNYVLPSVPGNPSKNNVRWVSSPVSGFFGVGVLMKFF